MPRENLTLPITLAIVNTCSECERFVLFCRYSRAPTEAVNPTAGESVPRPKYAVFFDKNACQDKRVPLHYIAEQESLRGLSRRQTRKL